METETTTLPFIFVDGKKYVLDEDEERPEPEIFGKLTPPPREVSKAVEWRLFLCREGDLLLLAFFTGVLLCSGTLFIFGGDFRHFASWILGGVVVPMLPFVLVAAHRISAGMRGSVMVIQFLREGLIGKGRFFGMKATGKVSRNAPEIEWRYQFTSEDGNTRNAYFVVTDIWKSLELTDESLKLILYDAIQPNRNILFDTLPRGIEFNETTGTFYTNPWFLMMQAFWLCFAFSAVPAIILLVAVFLC